VRAVSRLTSARSASAIEGRMRANGVVRSVMRRVSSVSPPNTMVQEGGVASCVVEVFASGAAGFVCCGPPAVDGGRVGPTEVVVVESCASETNGAKGPRTAAVAHATTPRPNRRCTTQMLRGRTTGDRYGAAKAMLPFERPFVYDPPVERMLVD
jgi:hypothetical protein